MEFAVESEVCDEPEKIWNVISDWKRITEFWQGTRKLEPEGEVFRIQFASSLRGMMKLDLDRNSITVRENYISGRMTGYKSLRFSNDAGKPVLRVEWNVRMKFPFNFMEKRLQEHFETGTRNALGRIVAAVCKQ